MCEENEILTTCTCPQHLHRMAPGTQPERRRRRHRLQSFLKFNSKLPYLVPSPIRRGLPPAVTHTTVKEIKVI